MAFARNAMFAALLVGLVACGGDDDDRAATSTTDEVTTTTTVAPSTTDSTTTSLPGSASSCSDVERSPAAFDADHGQYAVRVERMNDADPSIAFDVIQLLFGEAAVEAWDREHPDQPGGPPNDYFIVNESSQVRVAPIDDAARVRIVRLGEGTSLDPATIDELPAHLSAQPGNPWWLTFSDGRVVDVCEQYVP